MMKKLRLMKKINYILLSLISITVLAQTPTPAKKQSKSILLKNGTVHIGNGKVIENAYLGFKDGKINMIADATTIKLANNNYDTSINCEGKQIYPGFIAPNSIIGLSEIDAVRSTRDYAEVGTFNAHVRASIAFNADSKIIPTLRTNGILFAQATPRAGMVCGTSAIMNLDAWNWEDAAVKMEDGIHINFPNYNTFNWDNEAQELSKKKDEKFQKSLDELNDFFDKAIAYNAITTHEEKSIRYEAMKGVLDGSQNLYIHANNSKEILLAIDFVAKKGIKKPVIVDAKDCWKVVKQLKAANIPVILNAVHDLPEREDEDVDLPYKTPYLLQKEGVLFCLAYIDDNSGGRYRNLPFLAGTAAAYGLTKEEALQAITLNAAKILGVDKTIGSIEDGKSASFFISEGDALDMRGNNVIDAYIDGRKINLDNHQKQLYKKYADKYGVK
jgi:imidazolonepropionase-like amidohydrolase